MPETLTIPVRPPFAWQHSLWFVRGFPATEGEQVVEGDRLVRAWRFGEQTVATRVSAAEGGLAVELASEQPIGPELSAAVADRVGFHLSAEDDLREFDRTAAGDPGFAPVAARLRGYHQVKFPSPLENVVWAILAQRNPLPVAREAKRRLMRELNEPVRAFGTELLPFPSLAQLRALSVDDLAGLVRNERKATHLAGALEGFAALDEQFLRHGDRAEVEQSLRALPGIGPWSATFVLIRGLGRMDVVPHEKELLRAATRAYARPLTEPDLDTLAAPYAPHQAYWAHYLRAGG